MEEFEQAVLAIAITSSNIDKMDFIALNTGVLENRHYRSYSKKKLIDCCQAYKDCIILDASNEYLIRRFSQKRIEALINKAIRDGLVDESKAAGKIKKYIIEAKEKMEASL